MKYIYLIYLLFQFIYKFVFILLLYTQTSIVFANESSDYYGIKFWYHCTMVWP